MTTRIALIAAMPEEITPLLGRIGRPTPLMADRFKGHRSTVGDREVIVVESGIGPDNGAAAAEAVIAAASPDLLVSYGFAGALDPALNPGDLVVATRLLVCRSRQFSDGPPLSAPHTAALLASLGNTPPRPFAVRPATFVTAAEMMPKKELAARIPAQTETPVIEMETSAVARVAVEAGIPCVALRGVSDGLEEELAFDISEFTDGEKNVQAWRVVWTLARKPWILPQLIRLARNSNRAGRNLAAAIVGWLNADGGH